MSNNLLKGKRGIIFGALNDQSIAWKVAERAVEEGATITLSNTPMAIRMGEVNALAEKLNCQVVPADATSVEDLTNVFKTSMDILGGQIDFVLHSIGMSPNVRKNRCYDAPGQPPATLRAGASPACGGRHAEKGPRLPPSAFPLRCRGKGKSPPLPMGYL